MIPPTAAKVIGKTAVLEFYDFEADLTGPSVSGLAAHVPIAKGSLYDLLTAPATQTLADKGSRRSGTSSTPKHVVKAGPAPTKAVLLAEPDRPEAHGRGRSRQAHSEGLEDPARSGEHGGRQLQRGERELSQQPAADDADGASTF